MIDPEKRNAVYQLHCEGVSLRKIGRLLHLSFNTVSRIVRAQGKMPDAAQKSRIHIDEELLRRLYRQCDGRIRRIHEMLIEEENVNVGYSTLTKMLRDAGMGSGRGQRCDRVPDEPGAEMQHDTTVYRVKLAGQLINVIASLLYLRYSKRRYLKFYRAFNRFAMKCFLHEALMFWEYSAPLCIIDNTNLARLRGSGSRAVIVPEMVAFANQYGFRFQCHAIRRPNRKAGNERGFRTTETNFLPGRTFSSLADLNQQAFQWATQRLEHRPVGKAQVIPAKAFEHERLYLKRLPQHLPPPYQVHQRITDQYGYVALHANYYWVPGDERGSVKVFEYADHLKIYRRRECLAEYPLPADGVKEQRFSPPGQPQPRYQPKNRKRDSRQEEQRLRALGSEVAAYLDYALQAPGIQRHRFLRELFAFSRQLTGTVFVKMARRALRYRIVDLDALRRIAWYCMSQEGLPLPEADVDENLQQRPAYREGYLTEEPDLSIYGDMLREEEDQSDGENHNDDHNEESEDHHG
jgi:transposase